MTQGYVAMVLHAHLPYVRHPEQEEYLEEKWLFEAISETYIPLLNIFEDLLEEGTAFKATMSLTPPLLSMLDDGLLKERYLKYLDKLLKLTSMEIERTASQEDFNKLALMYNAKYKSDLVTYKDKYGCDLITAFKRLQASGSLEIIAGAATHGFLPLLDATPGSVRAQVGIGVKTYERFFDRTPRGIWLPECGYSESFEKVLKDFGIEYFILESHGILYADPRPVFGTYAPVATPNGLVAFGRDIDTSRQVWSSKDGYPGDYDYREYYRDIGYDLDSEYIRDFMASDGQRTHTGIKYYRITGPDCPKDVYRPEWARNKAERHAEDFVLKRRLQIESLAGTMDRPPVIVCPYDAELFGHWWYEGPYWLKALFKKACADQSAFRLCTLSEYISENPIMQVSRPCASTWGHKGYNEMWLNETNDWIYRHLHKCAERMVELANVNSLAAGLRKKALNQAARELLLAQSSDWAFIMKTGTMAQYAVKRTNDHLTRFLRLYHDIKEDTIDEAWLKEIENRDNIFPDIDYRIYSGG